MIDVRGTAHRRRSVLALALVAPLVGEFLLGNTPISELGSLIGLVPLYGCGAVLIREAARRTGRGWPAMLLLGAAYGLFEEGPVDQMLWNPRYGGVDFGLTYAGTHVPWLGTSVALLQDVVTMHMVWSVCVPIALVEAFGGGPRRPWLGRPGLIVTALVFAGGSASLAAVQYVGNDRFMASPWQWAVCVAAIAGLIAAAFRTGRRPVPAVPAAAPGPVPTGCAAFALTSAYWAGQALLRDRVPDWAMAAAWALLAAAAVLTVTGWSRRHGWGPRHHTALAAGALLTYVWVGFTQAGQTGTPPATALIGNVVFGTGACVLAVAAVRSAGRRGDDPVPGGSGDQRDEDGVDDLLQG
ncbi:MULTISPECIES: hypothetical protein [Streptomycetaceae]|uniref:Uncharacterized protein n=1 Tax=Streptantibioticus cattleyicolor (strain ATCC 35852 / DSM 46488 / JCM 4925 / NBRC 14057 / NRRL 8057) TaxID=1003195 RepID=F8JRN0_STREN|nr:MULTISPECIES: hypothetical protein [Streptomycetaceae]AEW97916.1 hypothetical protein SCATT_55450 [Streptantibioticus cattleyicolor NRRL 8057 = DSM 46488]MYS62322.1 hypothetical protein [Streptomyces sp. SID5468]CCB78232.1 conserved membrane protein of unknown function [Streptantibioticus cattleyicolor NRRL 8057 = DSM 46488]